MDIEALSACIHSSALLVHGLQLTSHSLNEVVMQDVMLGLRYARS